MPRGRPRKSAEYHRLVGNYRASRHAERAPTPPEPEPSPAELALREECERWRCAFGCGYDFFSQLDGLDPYGLDGAEWDVAAARFLAEMRKAWRGWAARSWPTGGPVPGSAAG
jgi:hypothetical protein